MANLRGDSADGAAVFGETNTGVAVFGQANGAGGRGVVGVSVQHTAVEGNAQAGVGVFATSEKNEAVHAETKSPGTACIAAFNNSLTTGSAIFAEKKGDQGEAAIFIGKVVVNGELEALKDIKLVGADLAENFDIADAELIDPGTVMVVGEEGALHQSHQAYDKRVAGVISGAESFKPGIVLDQQRPSSSHRNAIGMLGKVYCKVDANYGSVEVGDLLTTSATPGYAMKAGDPIKAFGAVLGKALRPFKEGQGLVPILIALQ